MKAFFKKIWKRHLIRPTVYKLVTKIMLSAAIWEMWTRGVNSRGIYNTRQYMGALLCALFATASWYSFLKLDGFYARRAKKPGPKKRKQSTSSMIDHIDTDPDAFGDLTDEEKNVCGFLSSLVLFIFFLICALI